MQGIWRYFVFMIVWCSEVFFFKQKTAYEMRISDWSSDVCSSDLAELYRLATDTLIALHQRWGGEDAGLLSYDADRLLAEVALLVNWSLPAVTGRETLPAQRASYLADWREVLPAMLSVPHKLVLRDFHVEDRKSTRLNSGN